MGPPGTEDRRRSAPGTALPRADGRGEAKGEARVPAASKVESDSKPSVSVTVAAGPTEALRFCAVGGGRDCNAAFADEAAAAAAAAEPGPTEALDGLRSEVTGTAASAGDAEARLAPLAAPAAGAGARAVGATAEGDEPTPLGRQEDGRGPGAAAEPGRPPGAPPAASRLGSDADEKDESVDCEVTPEEVLEDTPSPEDTDDEGCCEDDADVEEEDDEDADVPRPEPDPLKEDPDDASLGRGPACGADEGARATLRGPCGGVKSEDDWSGP